MSTVPARAPCASLNTYVHVLVFSEVQFFLFFFFGEDVCVCLCFGDAARRCTCVFVCATWCMFLCIDVRDVDVDVPPYRGNALALLQFTVMLKKKMLVF